MKKTIGVIVFAIIIIIIIINVIDINFEAIIFVGICDVSNFTIL